MSSGPKSRSRWKYSLLLLTLIATVFVGKSNNTYAQAQTPVSPNAQITAPERRDQPPVPVEGLRQIFRAGFEEPVLMAPDASGRQARLSGRDSYGYKWSDIDHVFELVAPGAFDQLVTLNLASDYVYSGKRALFLRQNKQEAGAQARLQFFSDDRAFGPEIFTRRYYFIPSKNLQTLAREQQSTSIAGTREYRRSSLPAGHPLADFSMPLYLVRRGQNLVFAQAIVDYSAGEKWSDWTRAPKGLLTYGDMIVCPLDRWFRLDIYILRSRTEGKILVWLDDKQIFNLSGIRTKNYSDSWFTKLADVDSEPAPFEAWVDDVEIWSR